MKVVNFGKGAPSEQKQLNKSVYDLKVYMKLQFLDVSRLHSSGECQAKVKSVSKTNHVNSIKTLL